MGQSEMTIQSHWQHSVHKIQDDDKHNTAQKSNRKISNTDPTKTMVNTSALESKQFMSLIRHPPCYSYGQDVLDTSIHKQTQITNKTPVLLQTTEGKEEPNIVCMRKW